MRSGPAHHNWRGGTKRHPDGYIYRLAHGHPRATKDGYVLEHILVMEEKIGRRLKYFSANDPRNEIPHHKNGLKADNRLENLELTTKSLHQSLHRKITDDMVLEIKSLWSSGFKSHQALAARFGVSKSSIGNLVKHFISEGLMRGHRR